jgi:hypothetical protein
MAFLPEEDSNGEEETQPEEIVAKLRQVDVLVPQGMGFADAIRSIGVSEVTEPSRTWASLRFWPLIPEQGPRDARRSPPSAFQASQQRGFLAYTVRKSANGSVHDADFRLPEMLHNRGGSRRPRRKDLNL